MPTVLLIEDDDGVRAFCRMLLEMAGYRVREAADGHEGMQAYRQKPADLVVCDGHMPRLDGLQVLQELRREFPGVRSIIMSGGNPKAGRDYLRDALPLGAIRVLPKPFTPAQLQAAVAEALR